MRRLTVLLLGAASVLASNGALARAALPAQAMLGYHGHLLGMGAVQGGAPRRHAPTAPAANFTFLDYPGSSYSAVFAINPGVKASTPMLMTGAFGSGLADFAATKVAGFGLQIKSAKGVTTESYRPIVTGLNDPYPSGINDTGVIVGTNYDASGVATGFELPKNGALISIVVPYSGATNTTVSALNNKGIVVGAYYGDDGNSATGFTWDKGVFTQLPNYPGSTYTWPYAINNAGAQVGDLIDQAGVTHGYLFENNAFTLIDPPGSVYTIAIGINDAGEIVGFYCTELQYCSVVGPFEVHGFAYSNGTYRTLDVPGVPLTELDTVNDAGVAGGYYLDTNGLAHGVLVNP